MRARFLAAVAIAAAILPEVTTADQPGPPRVVARVWVFTTTECPIANRYVPEIRRLAGQFGPQGVKFTIVYPVPSDTDAMVREHLAKYEIDLTSTRDPGFAMVKKTGVTMTPEVAVLDEDSHLLYRGRIDDRYVDFGKERAQPTSRDLENALDAIVAGKPVPVAKTRAVGCYLADLLK